MKKCEIELEIEEKIEKLHFLEELKDRFNININLSKNLIKREIIKLIKKEDFEIDINLFLFLNS